MSIKIGLSTYPQSYPHFSTSLTSYPTIFFNANNLANKIAPMGAILCLKINDSLSILLFNAQVIHS